MHARFRMIVALMTLSAAAVLLSGCDTVKPPPAARQDPLPIGAYPNIVVLEGLQEGLVAEKPIVDPPTTSRPMKVTVPMRSVADYSINVQYRFEFFDKEHRPTKETTGWQFMNIASRVQTHMVGSAMDTDAVDWRLQVRPAR